MSSDFSYEMDCLSEGLLGMLDSQIHVVVVMVVVVNVLKHLHHRYQRLDKPNLLHKECDRLEILYRTR